MECKEARAKLLEALWRKHPRAYSEELAAHLAGCDKCAKEEAAVKKMWELLQSAELPELSDAFWDRLSGKE